MSPEQTPPPGEKTSQQKRSAALPQTIGARVRELRLSRGWSQQRLAEMAGLCKDAITRVERGHRKPRLDTLSRIATAVGFPLTKLVDFDEAVPHEPATDERTRLLLRLVGELDPRLLDAVITFVRSLVRLSLAKCSRPVLAGGARSSDSSEGPGSSPPGSSLDGA